MLQHALAVEFIDNLDRRFDHDWNLWERIAR